MLHVVCLQFACENEPVLLGHGWVLQSWICTRSPVQLMVALSSKMQSRMRLCLPPPHDRLHLVHSDHSPHESLSRKGSNRIDRIESTYAEIREPFFSNHAVPCLCELTYHSLDSIHQATGTEVCHRCRTSLTQSSFAPQTWLHHYPAESLQMDH